MQQSKNGTDLNGSSCFSTWEKCSVCENCISMRSMRENKAIMKLEYSNKRLYMVTAVPVNNELNSNLIVELIRDVTEEHLLDAMDLLNEDIVIEKINKLNQELICDPLTKLYNRRFLEERLQYEMAKSFSNNSPMGFVMVDIDHFKNINDNYGHPVGDRILIEFSLLLKNMIRESNDWIVRYGGEEFLIFISGVSREILIRKVESIREKIEKNIFCEKDFQIKITSSFGIYSGIADENLDLERAKVYINYSDKALYHSKNTGRNKVSYYSEEQINSQYGQI
ncbi:MAG: GGDEF domain-containing protein [Mobilitalea sp.]